MAKLSTTVLEGFEQKPDEDFNAYLKRTDELMRDLQDKAAALPEGKYEGAVLSFPWADGNAMYLVEKTRPLTLQHIPYGDAWQIPDAHLRGLNLDDVKTQVSRSKGLRSMFPRRP